MAFVLTLGGRNIPEGYLDEDNVAFVAETASKQLADFRQVILFQKDDVVRAMTRVFSERCEDIPSMNRRAIMDLVHDFRLYQAQVNKHLKWGDHYTLSQKAYDPTTERRSFAPIKLRNRLGRPLVGGTLRFAFIS